MAVQEHFFVHLHDQLGVVAVLFELVIELNHRKLHEVGRSPLNGGIHRHALGIGADRGVPGSDIREGVKLSKKTGFQKAPLRYGSITKSYVKKVCKSKHTRKALYFIGS
jgi:hypothetical protein